MNAVLVGHALEESVPEHVGGELDVLPFRELGRGLFGDPRAYQGNALGRDPVSIAAQQERSAFLAALLIYIAIQPFSGLARQGHLLCDPLPLPQHVVEPPVVVLGEVQGRELAGAKPGMEQDEEDGGLEERALVLPVAELDPLVAGAPEAHDLDVCEAAPVRRVDDQVLHAGQGVPCQQGPLLVEPAAEVAHCGHGAVDARGLEGRPGPAGGCQGVLEVSAYRGGPGVCEVVADPLPEE